MNSIPAPSSDPGGSPANVATWWKDTLGIAANLVAIAAAASPLLPLIQASPYYVIAVSVVAATGGFLFSNLVDGQGAKKQYVIS